MRSKHRGPLHVLLDYMGTVSAAISMSYLPDHVISNLDVQRTPGCDMALVHDDDLIPILSGLGAGDVTVSWGRV